MKKKDLVVVNAVDDVLNIKSENPSKINDELLSIFIEKGKNKIKKEMKLLWVSSADKALKLKTNNPKLSKKEIAQLVLDGSN